MVKSRGTFSNLRDNAKVSNLKPVNSMAARISGANRQQKFQEIKIQIKRRKKELKRNISPERKEWLQKEISKLEARMKYQGPSDKSLLSKSAIKRAEKALERAKWERENRGR